MIHIGRGPGYGHYVAVVKNHGQWLLFDDETVIVSKSLELLRPIDPEFKGNIGRDSTKEFWRWRSKFIRQLFSFSISFRRRMTILNPKRRIFCSMKRLKRNCRVVEEWLAIWMRNESNE